MLFFLSLATSQSLGSSSVQGAFGAVTIDGKIWNQIALRPIIPIGKVSISLDIVLYIDQNGNVYDKDWDFSNGKNVKNSIVDKIYYIRYGKKTDPFYFQVGALDNVTLGQGILVNGYSNTILYPQERKVGMDIKFELSGVKFYGFTNDFKENLGLTGFRLSKNIISGITIGGSLVVDRNQYLGLRDSDNDGRPDLVDDFPDDPIYWLDTDGDGIADIDPNELDIDGDGVTDTLDNNIPGWNSEDIVVLDTDIFRKPEPLNLKEKEKSIYAVSLDASKIILSEKNMNVSMYAQFASLIGETIDPISGQKVSLGNGFIPFGLSTKIGPARFKFEYRVMPSGKFEFGYWDRSYEIERATFSSSPFDANSDMKKGEIITKDSKLGKFGKQKGYFSRLSYDLGEMVGASISYQNLVGEQWNDDENKFNNGRNQSFIASVGLKKPISKINNARWYYQQRNVPNPFDFEFTENTITGYRVGIKIGNGMILNYIFKQSFRDLDGDGKVDGEGETINMTSIETSFSF